MTDKRVQEELASIPDALPELIPFHVKDTGITLMIRKVSPNLMSELYKLYPPPDPPLNKVDFGDGKDHWETNKADPKYEIALRDHQVMLQGKIQRLMIHRGVSVVMTPEIRAAVEDLKSFWKEENGSELIGDDQYIYVSHIAVGTPEDLDELVTAIARRSSPTEAGIKAATDRFPDQIPG
jgi:hypothetical protein